MQCVQFYPADKLPLSKQRKQLQIVYKKVPFFLADQNLIFSMWYKTNNIPSQ